MENKQPLLSICIPEYNGKSSSLELVMDYLVPIAEVYRNEINIIVSDNCSTDGTLTMLDKYNSLENIIIYRNEENKGFNGNIKLLIDKYADGDYTWIVGDDDVVNPDVVSFIIQHLSSNELDYISLMFEFVEEDEVKSKCDLRRNYTLVKSSYAQAIDNNCLRGNTLASFMGASIFRTSIVRKLPKGHITKGFQNFYDVFPNAYLMATGFHDLRCAYIPEPAIYPIVHTKGWATSDNFYMITSRVVPDLYDYIINLGVKKEELRNTRRRIVFDNVWRGMTRLLKLKKIDMRFWDFLIESFEFKGLISLVLRNIIRKLMGRSFIDIG